MHWEEWLEEELITREEPPWGQEREVESVLDDTGLDEELELEHIPVYSSGRKLLMIVGARVIIRGAVMGHLRTAVTGGTQTTTESVVKYVQVLPQQLARAGQDQ
jgi:hypothetical protein